MNRRFIHDSIFVWNKHRDKLSFTIDIDKVKADTILSRKNRLKKIQKIRPVLR